MLLPSASAPSRVQRRSASNGSRSVRPMPARRVPSAVRYTATVYGFPPDSVRTGAKVTISPRGVSGLAGVTAGSV